MKRFVLNAVEIFKKSIEEILSKISFGRIMNKEYIVIVSEPWDFVGPDGKNRIKGKIINTIPPECIVFRCNKKISSDGKEGDILILKTRYYKESIELLYTEEYLTINGGLLLTEYDENMTSEELEQNSLFAIIGSLCTPNYMRRKWGE